jgi:monofunctional biosynthetic peptidoglycan transglycosylase
MTDAFPRTSRTARRLIAALLVTAAAAAAVVVAAWISASRRDLSGLDRAIPRRTALMAQREREARRAGRAYRVDQRPVPYARIAPVLRRAVLVAEDDAFFSHGGFDWNQIRASAGRNLASGRLVRGGSTITQQLAKNLWLGTARTPWRKLEEAFLAVRLERALSKRRIAELYLNCIEWGDGVFGIEAAARRHFGVAASQLTPRQAVLLAAVIVNPRHESPTRPSRRVERRARIIATRLHRRGVLDEAEARSARGLPPPAPAEPPAPGDSGAAGDAAGVEAIAPDPARGSPAASDSAALEEPPRGP